MKSQKNNIIKLFFMVLLLNLFLVGEIRAETQIVAGAGPSTKIVTLFVDLLAQTGAGKNYQFQVPKKSAKHAGGIKNANKYIFGRTGRPLNTKEKAGDVEELFLGKMPIAFVVGGKVGVNSLTVDQVCDVFTGKIKNWKEVGGIDHVIVVITREPREALFLSLKKTLPCMRQVVNTRYKFKKDHNVIQAITKNPVGAYGIGFGAVNNFPKNLIIQVSGFDSGVHLGLVHKKKHHDHPLVKAARDLVNSKNWQDTLRKNGLGQVD